MENSTIIIREYNGITISQRRQDQYIDATAMCRASGKKWHDYSRLDSTMAFIEALSESAGIPADSLIESRSSRGGGTYVHPDIAIHLAQWCNPQFAVQVSRWVRELLATGQVRLDPRPQLNCAEPAQAITLGLAPMMERLEATHRELLGILIAQREVRERKTDLVDPREQVRKRWPHVSAKTLGSIIRHMDTLHRNNLGRPCPQLGFDANSPLMIERDHLWMVDRAIDRFLPDGPLFETHA